MNLLFKISSHIYLFHYQNDFRQNMIVRTIAFPPGLWKQVEHKATAKGLSAAALIRMVLIEKFADEVGEN